MPPVSNVVIETKSTDRFEWTRKVLRRRSYSELSVAPSTTLYCPLKASIRLRSHFRTAAHRQVYAFLPALFECSCRPHCQTPHLSTHRPTSPPSGTMESRRRPASTPLLCDKDAVFKSGKGPHWKHTLEAPRALELERIVRGDDSMLEDLGPTARADWSGV